MNYNRASGRYREEERKSNFTQVENIEAQFFLNECRSAVLH